MTKKSGSFLPLEVFFFFSLLFQINVSAFKYASSSCLLIEQTFQGWVFYDLAAHHLPLRMQSSVTIITVIYSHEDANVGDGSGSDEV